MSSLPIVDVGPLVRGVGDGAAAVAALDRACRESGFFYAVGHGVPDELRAQLAAQSAEFFAAPPERKAQIAMTLGGRAWRGWFPLHGELTSGQPDVKEGVYFGAELGDDDPRVRAGTPLHGRNLFPDWLPGWRASVLAWLEALTALGHALARGLSLGLGLPEDEIARRYTADPLVLFRVFHYPALPPAAAGASRWGVGEHTDYGLLTILAQDDTGGLEVKTDAGWIDAPPVPDAFVCNLGDMLDQLTGGAYRSTPHRARIPAADRLSFPFFFDPAWTARLSPLVRPGEADVAADRARRWDGASVHDASGTYGDYLLRKVGRVFPDLGAAVLR
jgi:isopenicillin N synthase-like dioxygenase